MNEQIQTLSTRRDAAVARLASVHNELRPVEQRVEELHRSIRSMHGGNSATLRELQEEKSRQQVVRDRAADRLGEILRRDLALALAGATLRRQLSTTLRREVKRAEWAASKVHTSEKLDHILVALDSGPPPIFPELTGEQRETLRSRLRQAWLALWHPPPDDVAGDERHTYLDNPDRRRVQDHLARIDALGVSVIDGLLAEHEDATARFERCNSQLASMVGLEDRLAESMKQLEQLQERRVQLQSEERELGRQVQTEDAEINKLKAEQGRLSQRHESARPNLMRAAKAERIAKLLADAIDDLYPKHVQRLGEEMTVAYRRLAHKALVKRIEIAPDCTVRLLGDRDVDVRSMDASAGEEQIFALALIAAITKVSGARVPIVMDTPLARLDTDHRTNVLRYFASSASEQIIFLSQPDEINGEYLRVIRDRVARAFHIEYEELGNGVGRAHVRRGYFRGEEF